VRIPILAGDPAPAIAVTEPPPAGRKVYVETYGCQMNVSDTELILGILRPAGYDMAPSPELADVILLNTCAIRDHAEQRVWGRLGELAAWKRRNPDLVLGVVGCMAKHVGEALTADTAAVDVLASPDAYRGLPALIAAAGDTTQLDLHLDKNEDYAGIDPVRRHGIHAWITIERGCDKFCTFCVVPYVRGRERGVPAEEVVRQATEHARAGGREVTLLGQTVNAYRHAGVTFAGLLEQVARVPGIQRIRFTSPHPSEFDAETLRVMAAHPNLMRHVHLPVQSGSDRILAIMRRDYSVADYCQLVARMRAAMPEITLTTDIIVGFPGEEEPDFQATLALVREIGYESAFMFKYSERQGTIAQREIPETVDESLKGERLTRLIELVESIAAERNRGWEGRRVEVLVEGTSRRDPSRLYGRTEHGKTVVFPAAGAEPGELVTVAVQGSTSHTLHGELVAREDGRRAPLGGA
jgi:tRNA-2-methylthio-N6-dimethylallyladenosine synthase